MNLNQVIYIANAVNLILKAHLSPKQKGIKMEVAVNNLIMKGVMAFMSVEPIFYNWL